MPWGEDNSGCAE